LLDFQVFSFNIEQLRFVIILRQNPKRGAPPLRADAKNRPENPVFIPVSEQGKTVERRRRKVSGLKSNRPRRWIYQKARATVHRNVEILHTARRTKSIFQSCAAVHCQALSVAFSRSLTLIVYMGARA
jgi:hypothetical protein